MGYSSSRMGLCLVLFFTFAFISSARVSVSFSETEMTVVRERSLMVSTNDYSDPTANGRHDPPRGGRGRRR
ncbi:Protein PSY3 [Cardamine amara subsp. amara]|uniref:Protein PSY3 n=1 Tax=Cardamine amara subsp. amara TaxID=228776 RepID=A0ABD1BQY8_CARAN